MTGDDDGVIVGYRRMSEFANSEGYPVSTSVLQKRGSPAINTGPDLVGYFGHRPATTKGLLRKWLRSGVRTTKRSISKPASPVEAA